MKWPKTTALPAACALLALIGVTGTYAVHHYLHRGATYLPPSAWQFSGYATPEDTIKSALWARSVGNSKALLYTATPEMSGLMEAALFGGKTNQDRSAILIASLKKIHAVRIQKKTVLADGEISLELRFDGLPDYFAEIATYTNLDGEWKFTREEIHSGQRVFHFPEQ